MHMCEYKSKKKKVTHMIPAGKRRGSRESAFPTSIQEYSDPFSPHKRHTESSQVSMDREGPRSSSLFLRGLHLSRSETFAHARAALFIFSLFFFLLLFYIRNNFEKRKRDRESRINCNFFFLFILYCSYSAKRGK